MQRTHFSALLDSRMSLGVQDSQCRISEMGRLCEEAGTSEEQISVPGSALRYVSRLPPHQLETVVAHYWHFGQAATARVAIGAGSGRNDGVVARLTKYGTGRADRASQSASIESATSTVSMSIIENNDVFRYCDYVPVLWAENVSDFGAVLAGQGL